MRGTTEAGAQEHSASGRDHGEWASAGAAVVLAAAPQHSSSCCSSWRGTTRSGKWGDGVADAVVEQEGVRAWTGLERTGYGAWRARPQARDGLEASGLHGREVDERGVRRRKEGERGGRGRGPHRRLQGHMGVEARGRPVGRRTGMIDGDGEAVRRGSGGTRRRHCPRAVVVSYGNDVDEGGVGLIAPSRSRSGRGRGARGGGEPETGGGGSRSSGRGRESGGGGSISIQGNRGREWSAWGGRVGVWWWIRVRSGGDCSG